MSNIGDLRGLAEKGDLSRMYRLAEKRGLELIEGEGPGGGEYVGEDVVSSTWHPCHEDPCLEHGNYSVCGDCPRLGQASMTQTESVSIWLVGRD